jgi:hypothetical protein
VRPPIEESPSLSSGADPCPKAARRPDVQLGDHVASSYSSLTPLPFELKATPAFQRGGRLVCPRRDKDCPDVELLVNSCLYDHRHAGAPRQPLSLLKRGAPRAAADHLTAQQKQRPCGCKSMQSRPMGRRAVPQWGQSSEVPQSVRTGDRSSSLDKPMQGTPVWGAFPASTGPRPRDRGFPPNPVGMSHPESQVQPHFLQFAWKSVHDTARLPACGIRLSCPLRAPDPPSGKHHRSPLLCDASRHIK